MKIDLYLSGKKLTAMLHRNSGDREILIGESKINSFLESLYLIEGKSFGELVSSGLIVIKDDIWKEVELKDNRKFVKKTIAKPVPTPVPTPKNDAAELTNFDEIVKELIKLNPTANIVPTPVTTAGLYEITSDLPGDKLVLPKGFEYNDKNGITNKHHTKNGSYIVINVKQLVKENSPEAQPEKPINHAQQTNSDGSVDPIIEDEKNSASKPKKGIKNFKAKLIKSASIIGALVIGGYAIYGGINNAIKNNTTNTNDGEKLTYEIDGSTVDSSYTEPETVISPEAFQAQDNNNYADEDYFTDGQNHDVYYEPISDEERFTQPYADYGSNITFDDMETQIQEINNICFSHEPCYLENLVVEDDFGTMMVVNGYRNDVLSKRKSAYDYMNEIVNYVFENGTEFNGYNIKSFESLSPFAKYIVLVSGQSMLQFTPNYSHQTSMNNYDAHMLSVSFDYEVDSIHRTLMNISSKSR